MTKGNDTLYFIYDAEGTPVSVKYNGVLYNYVTNLQGDVTAILTWSGQKEWGQRDGSVVSSVKGQGDGSVVPLSLDDDNRITSVANGDIDVA